MILVLLVQNLIKDNSWHFDDQRYSVKNAMDFSTKIRNGIDLEIIGPAILLDKSGSPKKVNNKNYNIEVDVSDFDKKNIKIETTKNFLTILGKNGKVNKKNKDSSKYKNTEEKQFTRSFVFSDNFKVKKAKMNKNLLTINLVSEFPTRKREKPKLIKI